MKKKMKKYSKTARMGVCLWWGERGGGKGVERVYVFGIKTHIVISFKVNCVISKQVWTLKSIPNQYNIQNSPARYDLKKVNCFEIQTTQSSWHMLSVLLFVFSFLLVTEEEFSSIVPWIIIPLVLLAVGVTIIVAWRRRRRQRSTSIVSIVMDRRLTISELVANEKLPDGRDTWKVRMRGMIAQPRAILPSIVAMSEADRPNKQKWQMLIDINLISSTKEMMAALSSRERACQN